MTSDYKNLIANVKLLKEDEVVIESLSIITELLIQVRDGQLRGADYFRQFLFGRLSMTISIEKERSRS